MSEEGVEHFVASLCGLHMQMDASVQQSETLLENALKITSSGGSETVRERILADVRNRLASERNRRGEIMAEEHQLLRTFLLREGYYHIAKDLMPSISPSRAAESIPPPSPSVLRESTSSQHSQQSTSSTAEWQIQMLMKVRKLLRRRIEQGQSLSTDERKALQNDYDNVERELERISSEYQQQQLSASAFVTPTQHDSHSAYSYSQPTTAGMDIPPASSNGSEEWNVATSYNSLIRRIVSGPAVVSTTPSHTSTSTTTSRTQPTRETKPQQQQLSQPQQSQGVKQTTSSYQQQYVQLQPKQPVVPFQQQQSHSARSSVDQESMNTLFTDSQSWNQRLSQYMTEVRQSTSSTSSRNAADTKSPARSRSQTSPARTSSSHTSPLRLGPGPQRKVSGVSSRLYTSPPSSRVATSPKSAPKSPGRSPFRPSGSAASKQQSKSPLSSRSNVVSPGRQQQQHQFEYRQEKPERLVQQRRVSPSSSREHEPRSPHRSLHATAQLTTPSKVNPLLQEPSQSQLMMQALQKKYSSAVNDPPISQDQSLRMSGSLTQLSQSSDSQMHTPSKSARHVFLGAPAATGNAPTDLGTEFAKFLERKRNSPASAVKQSPATPLVETLSYNQSTIGAPAPSLMQQYNAHLLMGAGGEIQDYETALENDKHSSFASVIHVEQKTSSNTSAASSVPITALDSSLIRGIAGNTLGHRAPESRVELDSRTAVAVHVPSLHVASPMKQQTSSISSAVQRPLTSGPTRVTLPSPSLKQSPQSSSPYNDVSPPPPNHAGLRSSIMLAIRQPSGNVRAIVSSERTTSPANGPGLRLDELEVPIEANDDVLLDSQGEIPQSDVM